MTEEKALPGDYKILVTANDEGVLRVSIRMECTLNEIKLALSSFGDPSFIDWIHEQAAQGIARQEVERAISKMMSTKWN